MENNTIHLDPQEKKIIVKFGYKRIIIEHFNVYPPDVIPLEGFCFPFSFSF